jgi:hypothetical protein
LHAGHHGNGDTSATGARTLFSGGQRHEEEHMAGIDVRVAARQGYMLEIPSTNGNRADSIMAQAVDTLGWVSGMLLVRVYSASLAASSTLTVVVRPVMFGSDDPTIVGGSSDLCSVTISGSGNFPILYTASLTGTSPIPRYVRVTLRGQSGGQAGQTTVDCAVNLIGRDA